MAATAATAGLPLRDRQRRPDLWRQGRGRRNEPEDGRVPDGDGVLRRRRATLSADEVEKVVRESSTGLSDGAVQVASLHYVDPQRFGEAFAESDGRTPTTSRSCRKTSRVTPRAAVDDQAPAFAEEIIPFTKDRNITDALADSGYTGDDATGMAEAIAKLLNAPALKG